MDNLNNVDHIRTKSFSNYPKPNKVKKNWLKNINDNTLITELSIPGTHDSCSKFGYYLGTTQSWTIKDQLNAGIRYLDFRCVNVRDIILIFHGVLYQYVSLSDLFETIENFLNSNNDEFVIVRIREEDKPVEATMSFKEVFLKYYNAYKDIILRTETYPTVKDLRGKIFIIQDNVDIDCFYYRDFIIQDYFEIDKISIDKKIQYIKDYMNIANNTDKNNMVVNHFSGTAIVKLLFPYRIALKTNQVAFESDKYKKLGIMIFDFPGEDLIEYIINKNKNL